MSEQENLEIIRSVYQTWNDSKANSAEQWMAILDDNVKFRSLGNGRPGLEFSAECHCAQDVGRYLEQLVSQWEMLHYTVDEYICQGDRIVAIGNCGWKHRQSGKSIDTPKVDIIRMRDGKVVEFFELFDTATVLDATG